MIEQVFSFFSEVLKSLQNAWNWCVNTGFQIGNFSFTPLTIFGAGLFVFLGILIVLLIKNLIL